jgi:hypothetical protein
MSNSNSEASQTQNLSTTAQSSSHESNTEATVNLSKGNLSYLEQSSAAESSNHSSNHSSSAAQSATPLNKRPKSKPYSNQKRIRDAGLSPIIGGDGKTYNLLQSGNTFLIKYTYEPKDNSPKEFDYIFIAEGDGDITLDGIQNRNSMIIYVKTNGPNKMHPFCHPTLWNDYVKYNIYDPDSVSQLGPVISLKRSISNPKTSLFFHQIMVIKVKMVKNKN